jgi:hypothetical protein
MVDENAWDIRGWTAQNFAYLDTPEDDVDPDFPVGVSYVTLTGKFFTEDGEASGGTLVFTPAVKYVISGGHLVRIRPIKVELKNGRIPADFKLVASKDVDNTPSEWTWEVRQRIDGSSRKYNIMLDATQTPVNLATLVPVEASVGTVVAGCTPNQTSASTAWIIDHNLGFDPAGILVIDAEGDRQWPQITYPITKKRIRLDFSAAVTGTAYLS